MDVHTHQIGHKEGAFSFIGRGRGFGSFRSNNCAIVSMGHHFSPLGELSRFGFVRERALEGDKEGVWLRLVDPFGQKECGSVWAEVIVSYLEDVIELSSRIENFGDDVDISMVFFLQGDSLSLDERVKTFGLLERYRGDVLPITLATSHDTIKIIPEFEGVMQIIPLAGDNSYWGANYLLAFELSEKEKQYKWLLS